jgi:ferric enterobactin receptor
MRKNTLLLVTIFLLCNGGRLFAQAKAITGTIVADDDNNPLQGVTVTNKNTGKKAQTNNAGYYSIQAEKGHVLVFTFVGFLQKQLTVADDYSISARLARKTKEETVVTVYGTRKSKRELPYMAQEVDGDDIAQTKRENFINALAGRVAGANITPTSGVPGASSSIVLRGAVSIGGNNQPLFVVDGIPVDNQTMNQENLASGNSISLGNRTSDYGNRAMDINPEDIESVTVLKGPEATALYGSDGASGAIIITTRKGKTGKAAITYSNSFRWEKLYRFPETQREYMRGLNGVSDPNATVNPFAGGVLTAFFGPKYPAGTKFYDNLDAFFQTGFTQRHDLTVEGGGEGNTYRLSTSYQGQKGIVPNTGFERLQVRLGNSMRLSPKFNINTSASFVTSTTDKASKGVGSYLLTLLNWPADVDVRDYQNADGSRKILRGTALGTTESDNPFWDVNKNTAQDKVDRLTGNVTLNYDPFKWVSLNAITGIDWYGQSGYLLTHPQSRFGFSTNGFYSIYQQRTVNWNSVLKATFRKRIGKFNNTFIVGYANDDNKTQIEAQRGENFYELNFKSINNTTPTSRDAKTSVLNNRKVRFFGNYTIGYDNIVYASVAGSREGTSTFLSRFLDKNPYYNFGSASLSFVFSDLNLFRNVSWLNYGKARISYGTTGKGPIFPYIIDNTFNTQITTGGGFAYGVTGNNYALRPEFTKNFEFGGELKLFKSRLTLDVTRYSLRSKDQILAARTSYGTGYVLKYINGGLVENKGLEIVLTGNPISTKTFKWDVIVNFDRNRGKILEMPKGLPTYYDSDTWVFGNLRSQAYAGAFTGNLSGSIFSTNTNGDIIVSPTSGLPTSTGADFFIVGDRQPDFRVGLINKFVYKQFSLDFNLDFRKGGDVFNGNEYYLFLTGLSKKTLNRETPVVIKGVLNDGLQNTKTPTANNIVITPLYRSDYYGATAATESDFIESVNWMRLRDITLSYQLPKKLLSRQKIVRNASIYVTGTDVFIVTNYTGADPSVNSNTAFSRGYGGAGIDYGSLSTPRGILFGCRLQF